MFLVGVVPLLRCFFSPPSVGGASPIFSWRGGVATAASETGARFPFNAVALSWDRRATSSADVDAAFLLRVMRISSFPGGDAGARRSRICRAVCFALERLDAAADAADAAADAAGGFDRGGMDKEDGMGGADPIPTWMQYTCYRERGSLIS